MNPLQANGLSGQQRTSPYLSQLTALGIKPTGSAQGDLQAIQEAQGSGNNDASHGVASSDQAGAKKAKPPQSPYHDQLMQLGIKPTGTAQGDWQAIQAAQQRQQGGLNYQA